MNRQQQQRAAKLQEQILDIAVKNELRRFLDYLQEEVGEARFQELIRGYRRHQAERDRLERQLATKGITRRG